MKKLKVGVIGCGDRGQFFCGLFAQNPRSQLIAAADKKPDRLQLVKNKYGDSIKLFANHRKMLELKDLDAVAIITYDHEHLHPTVDALSMNKHVLLEKPMAQTVEDCRLIVKASRESEAIFMTALELRYVSIFEQMKRLLDQGVIGRPVIGSVYDNVSVGGHYYYHSRTRRKEFIKSLVIQKACHSLDLANWFVGSRPKRVYAVDGLDYYGGNESNEKRCQDCDRAKTCPFYLDYNRFVLDYGKAIQMEDLCVWAKEVDTPDNSEMLITYENGARVNFIECHFTPEYSREFMFIGDKGRIYGHYNNEGDFLIRIKHRFSLDVNEYRPTKNPGPHGGGDFKLIESFIDCIMKDEQPRSNIQAAYDSTVLAICAEKSAAIDRPVEVPLEDFSLSD